jgi:hypothetical protein
MRNLIVSGTAMVLVIGACFFVAAQHAARHPDSFVGRCAMTIFHMWEPLMVPQEEAPELKIAQAPQESPSPTVAAKIMPPQDIIEPIAVEPTEQEPPLDFPRLSPEVAAAIERLRSDEESEPPPQVFEGLRATLRMPYADGETEALPALTTDRSNGSLVTENHRSGNFGFFFMPNECWQAVFETVVKSLNLYGKTDPGNEESADEGTSQEETSSSILPLSIPNYHATACPYIGGCPQSYYHRYQQPVATWPETAPPTDGTKPSFRKW